MSTGQPIELCYARQLAKNYKEQKLDKGKLLTNDTQAVWFSKEVLLEALGVAPGAGSGDVSGIRFYFGAYEEKPGFPENPFDRNKLTLVMVQTGLDSIQINRDGIPETAFLDIIISPDTKPSYPPTPGPVAGKVYFNEGQTAPPPMPAASLGLMDF